MGLLDTMGAISTDVSLAGSAVSLANVTKSLVTGKKLPPGIAGFLFDIPQETSVSYSAQITDHWLESNTAIQDHVAIEPLKITCTGVVAELVWTKSKVAEYAETILNNLAPIGILSPSLSLQAQESIAAAEALLNNAQSVLNQAKTLTGLFDGDLAGLNNQQKAFIKFENLFLARTSLTVETPFKTYENMLIESFEGTQNEDTTTQSTFSLSFKQISTVSATRNTGKLVGRIAKQAGPVIEKGTEQGASAAVNTIEFFTGTKVVP